MEGTAFNGIPEIKEIDKLYASVLVIPNLSLIKLWINLIPKG